MAVRDEVHQLVDTLPERQLPVVRRYLESLADVEDNLPRQFLDTAPVDDEETSPGEKRWSQEAWHEYERLGGIPSAEAKWQLLR